MNLQLALYKQAAQLKLDARAMAELRLLAGLGGEPRGLQHVLARGGMAIGGALAGVGVIFWIAANWAVFGRFGRIALIEILFTGLCASLLWRPAWRAPLGLFGLLAIGAQLACIGQTYQTGADPWELFALWFGLAIPLCLNARSDVLWLPWTAVATTAISLWVSAHTDNWWASNMQLSIQLPAWAIGAALGYGLSAPFSRLTGAGQWSRGFAWLMLTIMIATPTFNAIDSSDSWRYWLAVTTLLVGILLLSSAKYWDMPGLCAMALAVDVLTVFKIANTMLLSAHPDIYVFLLSIAVIAAALLTATVKFIMWQYQRHASIEVAP